MKYLLFSTVTENYSFSNDLPSNSDNFDIIDLENKKVISGPQGPCDLKEFTEDEVQTEEIETEG